LPNVVRKTRRLVPLLLGIFLLGMGPSFGLAQRSRSAASPFDLTATVRIEEIEPSARVHLERVQQFLDAGQWNEAVDSLRRVMESDGQRLMAVSDAGDRPLIRHVTVSRYCQGILSRWHEVAPQALEQYRREVDAVARRWYEEAVAEGSESKLRDLVEQFFVSSVGDDALLLLGEYALERGDYPQARYYWEQIDPRLRSAPLEGVLQGASRSTAPGRPRWLAWRDHQLADTVPLAASVPAGSSTSWISYPDSDVPLADVQARLVFVSLLEGDWRRAEIELELLRQTDPEARGTILGREGIYVELLEELAEEARSWHRPLPSDVATFGSTPQRIPLEVAALSEDAEVSDLDVSGPPLWRVRLPHIPADRDLLSQRRPRTGESMAGCLSYHPIVVDSAVLVAQAGAVRAFQLETGRPLIPTDPLDDSLARPRQATDSGALYRRDGMPVEALGEPGRQWGVPRYTVTATRRRVFTRMGTPITRWRNLESPRREMRSHLIGLDLAAEGRLLPGYPLYADDAQWSFEGTPLVDDQLLYVAMRRQDEVRVESHLACFEALSGRLVWRRHICTSETPGEGLLHEVTHSLVTLDHETLYFNSHLGAVAAVDAATGGLRWLATYPRAAYPPRNPEDPALHHFRDLVPAIVWRGVAVFAPSDCRRIFAIDAAGGQLLWALPEDLCGDVKHLLGVSDDCLLASGDCLYWIDVYSGRLLTQFPAPRRQAIGYATAEPRGYGRGILHGGRIYWPTADQIFVFRQQPREVPGGWVPNMTRAPIDLDLHQAKGGNLVAASGVLLIAAADELMALWAGGGLGGSE
jgi:outer membrane protein assembly factor BamB